MSDRRSNNGWKFGLGLLAGAAVGYWLNSEQGRKVRKDTGDQINKYSNQATDYTKEKMDVAQNTLNNTIEKAQDLLHSLTDYAKNTISRTSNSAEAALEKAESSLEKGMNKAKKKVANNAKATAN